MTLGHHLSHHLGHFWWVISDDPGDDPQNIHLLNYPKFEALLRLGEGIRGFWG